MIPFSEFEKKNFHFFFFFIPQMMFQIGLINTLDALASGLCET